MTRAELWGILASHRSTGVVLGDNKGIEMTVEIMQAVRDYIEEIARTKSVHTVGDLVLAIEADIREKKDITEKLHLNEISI